MADIIIIAILAVIVFLIVRGRIRNLHSGQCTGGCPGCSGGSCCSGGCMGASENKPDKCQKAS